MIMIIYIYIYIYGCIHTEIYDRIVLHTAYVQTYAGKMVQKLCFSQLPKGIKHIKRPNIALDLHRWQPLEGPRLQVLLSPAKTAGCNGSGEARCFWDIYWKDHLCAAIVNGKTSCVTTFFNTCLWDIWSVQVEYDVQLRRLFLDMQNLPCMRWHHGRALQFNGHCLQGMQILRNFSRLLTKLQEACSIGLRKDKFTIEYHPASIESNQFILMGLHHLWQPKLTRHFLSWRNTVQHLINVSFWRS